jgi:DNA-binding SARP family transcriptional activator
MTRDRGLLVRRGNLEPSPCVGRTEVVVDVRLLGSFEVRRGGSPLALGGHRQRAVLAILALAPNESVSADVLAERLWSGSPPRGASGTLQAYVSNLRRVLEPDRAPRATATLLRSTSNGYLLALPDGSRDVDRFEADVAAARRSLGGGDPSTAVRLAQQALARWRGPALADLADEPFAAADILRLEEARLQVVELQAEAQLAIGDHADVVASLRPLTDAHPLRERLRGQLMLALYRCGRQAEALEVARVGRELLAEELGIDPDPAIRTLERAILRQDPELAAPDRAASSVPVVTPPSRGPAGTRRGSVDGRLVGRIEEREVLDRALAAVTDGGGRAVLIGGEPGIGKTRLAEAFAREVHDASVVWGRCQELGAAPPFWPWRQVLRALMGELDAPQLRTVLGADAGVVLEVAPELADLIGAVAPTRVPDADTARFRFFEAAARLFAAVSEHRPIVVVLEDIHWADASSMAMLRHLVRALRGTATLIVATHRTVGVADRSLLATTLGALAREPIVERLLLPGLTTTEATALIGDLLGSDPDDELVDAVRDRTGGNPLFIIHLARLLEGVLDTDPEQARAAVHREVPPAVVDLIGMRVAEQPEPTRRLLEIAAVVGRRFELGLLVQVESQPFDVALATVEPAIAAGLVVEDAVAGTYRFTHALLREAIVAQLGRSNAGRLHGRIGDALATRGVDARSLPTLAHHYWEAAGIGWAEAALETASAAATAAMAGLAFEDAERHLEHASTLLARRPAGETRDRAELGVRLQLAKLHLQTRGYAVDEVGVACGRARELAERLGARSELLIARWMLAAHHLVRSEHRAAIGVAQELLAHGEREDDPIARLAGHQTTGVPSFYMGRAADAVHHLDRTLALVRTLPPEVLARFPQDVELGAMAFLAIARWLVGDEAGAEELRAEAIDRAKRSGGYDEVFILMVDAQLSVLRRSIPQLLAETSHILDRCGPVGFRHVAAFTRVLRGWAIAVDGDPREGLRVMDEGLAYLAEHERSTHRLVNLTLRAEALGLAGRLDEATDTIGAAIDELATTEERFYEPETWMVAARLRPTDPRAATWLDRAATVAEEAGAEPLRRRAADLAAITANGATTPRGARRAVTT